MIRTARSIPRRGHFGAIATLWLLVILPASVAMGLWGCAPGDADPSSRSIQGDEAAEPSGPGGGSSGPGGFPVTLQDASGASVEFLAPPKRIVSLVPSATRTLQALGAQDLLVGRTEYDTAAALAYLPSVGGGLEPSLETLLALEPDLVVRFAGESDPILSARLDAMGIRHMAVRLDRVEDVRVLFRDLGTVTGSDDRAGELLAGMDATLSEIRQRVAGRPRVRVAYILGGNPPWVAGPGTFIDELLATAGGENSFSDLNALYGPVSPEEFLVREIDILLAPEGGEVLLPPGRIPLVRVSPALELPGPDLAQATWQLAQILHPEVFR